MGLDRWVTEMRTVILPAAPHQPKDVTAGWSVHVLLREGEPP